MLPYCFTGRCVLNDSSPCFGCSLRCGSNKVEREDANMILENPGEFGGLALIVSKIYGLPMACMLMAVLFDHLVFPLDRIAVLSFLIISLPLIMLLAVKSIDRQLISKGLGLK